MLGISELPPDPLHGLGLGAIAATLRRGELTSECLLEAYLARIDVLEPILNCFECIDVVRARTHARAIDQLLQAGIDLGPLMGVPIAVKGMFAIDGLEASAGSKLPIADLIGAEGSFIRNLKRIGCVIIGTTKMAELALGGRTGINPLQGTPRNPWDQKDYRVPGASSSGSAVAVSAGLCALAIASDTGGSARLPAALCGIFGVKTTAGLWPTDGMFPSVPPLDTIGLMTTSAADAAWAFSAISKTEVPKARMLRGLRLGRPRPVFFDNLDPAINRCVETALGRLTELGASVVDVDVPEVAGIGNKFAPLLQAYIIASLGRERFVRNRELIGSWTWDRIAPALDMRADHCLSLLQDLKKLAHTIQMRLAHYDAWITPTAGFLAPTVENGKRLDEGQSFGPGTGPSTQRRLAVNLSGLCAASIPIHHLGASLPVGLQVICPPHQEEKLFSIALAIEMAVGRPQGPNLVNLLANQ